MKTEAYLEELVETVHTVVMAVLDEAGLPATCAIDLMDFDSGGLYFLTARGKRLYRRLRAQGTVSLTGLRGRDTLSAVAASVRGKVREVGADRLARLLEKNPYMQEIYPTEASRAALTVFQIYQGTGERFDLSCKPVMRETFAFGGALPQPGGYRVTEHCTGCGKCLLVCPQNCIDTTHRPAAIRQEHCLHCGNCAEICPVGAVVRREDG